MVPRRPVLGPLGITTVPHTNPQTNAQPRQPTRPRGPTRRPARRFDIGTFESNLPDAPPPDAPAPPPADRLIRLRRPDPQDPGLTGLAIRQPALRAPDAARLRAEIVAHHTPGQPLRVVLCLRGLTDIAAPCLATLAEIAESLQPTGGSLVLLEVPAPVARLLKRTGLAKTLRIARSPDHARKLSSPRKTPRQSASAA